MATLLVFTAMNGAISQISHRISRPLHAELGRAAAGVVLAPLAYLTTDAPFGMWWPAFLIMALGGVTFFGLASGSTLRGRLTVTYYVGALFLTEYLANPHPNWYSFWVSDSPTELPVVEAPHRTPRRTRARRAVRGGSG